MHEPSLVCVLEARRDVERDAAGLVVCERRALPEHVLERAVREVLEHDVAALVCSPVVVDGADVRVRERGGGAGFSFEPLAVGGGRERLQGHVAVELVVVREPDGAHRAAAQRLEQAIAPGDRLLRHRGGIMVRAVSRLPTIDEALALVLGSVQPLPAEEVAVADAAGRVLAEDAVSPVDLPPFPSSAMDGHAVRAGDTPGALRIVGQSAAGLPADRRLEAGEAIAISTGGVVPDGADAVVPSELSEDRGGGELRVPETAAGVNVRPRGGDVVAGDLVVRAGVRLGPAQVGALAACGIAVLRCGRRPRVAVVPTGTELRPPGEPLAPGEIYESNSLLLAAQIRSAGAEAELFTPVADDAVETRDVLERALAADVLLTSGGVSVGPHDFVREALAQLGAHEVFWRVAVKPGKPVAFATRGATLVFGLPGNPVSSLVASSSSCARRCWRCRAPRRRSHGSSRERSLSGCERGADRDELVRARIEQGDAGPLLRPVAGQESHMIARAATADALVLVPRGTGELPAGAHVSFLRV